MTVATLTADTKLDESGFPATTPRRDRPTAETLANQNDIGPLTEKHRKIIEYVKFYYQEHGTGPPVVKIGKATGLRLDEICRLFPCGGAREAYRLAGLPRPAGCV